MAKKNRNALARLTVQLAYAGFALILFAGAMLPILRSAKVYAYGQPQNREIMMSSSTAGNTGTQYTVNFKTATAGTIEGIVINFCDNDPIIGDSCTTTTQSVNNTGVTLTSISGPSDTTASHWTVSDSGAPNSSTPSVITLTNSASSTSEPANTQVSIVLSGFTNPSYASCTGGTVPNCPFYGRILTYTGTTGANSPTGYTPTSINTPTDAGGVALSTAAPINITSKVQEEIAFCVYNAGTGGTNTCTSAVAPNVALGNNNDVLSTSGPFVDLTDRYDIQTNASGSAAINMQGHTLQANGGTYSIPGISPASSAATGGTSQFGLCNFESSGTAGQLVPTSTSASATYSGTASSGTTAIACSGSSLSQTSGTSSTGGAGSGATAPLFYFNTSNTTGIPSTYGDTIATDAAGPTATGTLAFVGNIAITQTAGIYTTTLNLIADATY